MAALRRTALLLLLVAAAASAGEPRGTAHEHLKRGNAALAAGNYDAAIHELEAGFLADPDPQFTRLLADAYRLSGRPEQAVITYRMYLRQAPRAADHADAEQQIEAIARSVRNAAEAAELGGHNDDALALWQRYLDLAPADAGATRAHMESLRTALAPPPSTVPVVVAPAPPRPLWRQWRLWTAVGGTAVAIGVVVLALVLSIHADAEAPSTSLGNMSIHF
jgi:tetratricopeptide (TPR) repeat protein